MHTNTHTHTHARMSTLFALLPLYALIRTENVHVSQNVGRTLCTITFRNEFYSIRYCNPEGYESNPDNPQRLNKIITFFFDG